jgi:hypothetical protein
MNDLRRYCTDIIDGDGNIETKFDLLIAVYTTYPHHPDIGAKQKFYLTKK